MATENNVTLTGNITGDPELRFTPSGQPTTTFGLAVNRRWQNRQTQTWDETTSFFDVVCWAQLAENVAESITKGTRVIVSGRLDQRSWETATGDRRSKVEVTADEVAPSLRWATASVTKNDRRASDSDRAEVASQSGGPTAPTTHPSKDPRGAGQRPPGRGRDCRYHGGVEARP